MPYVLIIHEVADYLAWKAIFDAATGIRRDAGEIADQVLKYDTDPNRIVHYSLWRSLDAAREFFASERLIEIRARAGFKTLEFIYLSQLERGEWGVSR